MSRWQKGLTIGAAALTVLALGCVILVGAVYAASGVLSIRILERDGGLDLYIPLPATVVEGVVAGAAHAASGELDELRSTAAEWAPMAREIIDVLAETPDGTLVEVRDGRQRVLVTKRGGSIRVEVDADDVLVEVSAPIQMLRRTLGLLLA